MIKNEIEQKNVLKLIMFLGTDKYKNIIKDNRDKPKHKTPNVIIASRKDYFLMTTNEYKGV